jgi:hypothetical protein
MYHSRRRMAYQGLIAQESGLYVVPAWHLSLGQTGSKFGYSLLAVDFRNWLMVQLASVLALV